MTYIPQAALAFLKQVLCGDSGSNSSHLYSAFLAQQHCELNSTDAIFT